MILAFGQDQVREADVREVVRQLVGEARPVGRPVHPRLLEVLLAVGAEVPAAQFADGVRVLAVLPAVAPCRHRDLAEHG